MYLCCSHWPHCRHEISTWAVSMLFCRYASSANTQPAVWNASCACQCFRRTVRIRRLASVTCDTSVFFYFFPAKDSSLLQHLFPHSHDEAGATVKKTMFYNKFFATAVSSFCGGSCVYLFSLCAPPPNTSWHHRFIVCSLLLSLFIVMFLLFCYVVHVHTSLTTDTKSWSEWAVSMLFCGYASRVFTI